jgi:class 3 adenylate cyclase
MERALLTVAFTDIVDATGHAARLGDGRWRDLLESHENVVRRVIEQFGGEEIKTVGDGFLVTFEGEPSKAVRCSRAMVEGVSELGIELRVGLHTGECEIVDGHVRGIAVHIAARVMAHAGSGEVLCSRTVRDLVAGAGFAFSDRGVHRLKGVPDDWQLYAAEVTPG